MTVRPRFWVALGSALLAAGAGAFVADQTGNWNHFARSGAVIVMIGAVVTSWESLREGGGVIGELRHILSRGRMPSQTLGVCLMVIGTLIWAFGDLIGRLVA